MFLVEPLLDELQHEALGTRRMLDQVPADKLAWQPHEKSMTLGRLAAHIAELPGWLHEAILQDELDLSANTPEPVPLDGKEDILNAFDDNMAKGMNALQQATNQVLLTPWTLRQGEEIIFRMERLGVVRGMVLNHIIHHRGQLSVYLRMLQVPVPGMYGPSADELMG